MMKWFSLSPLIIWGSETSMEESPNIEIRPMWNDFIADIVTEDELQKIEFRILTRIPKDEGILELWDIFTETIDITYLSTLSFRELILLREAIQQLPILLGGM